MPQGHDCKEGGGTSPQPCTCSAACLLLPSPPPSTQVQPEQSRVTCISGCSSKNQRRGYVWACIMSTGTVNCSSRWKVFLWVRLGSNLLLQKPASSRGQGLHRRGPRWVLFHQPLPQPTHNPFQGRKVEARNAGDAVPVDTQLI